MLYLHAGSSEARQRHVGTLLEDIPEVADLTFHSSHESYREFKSVYKDQPEVLEDREAADFPGTYEVVLIPGAAYATIEATLVGTPGINKLVPGPCRDVGESPNAGGSA